LDQALPVNIPTYVHTFCIAQCFCFNLEETKAELKETCPKFALSLLLRYVWVECMSFFTKVSTFKRLFSVSCGQAKSRLVIFCGWCR